MAIAFAKATLANLLWTLKFELQNSKLKSKERRRATWIFIGSLKLLRHSKAIWVCIGWLALPLVEWISSGPPLNNVWISNFKSSIFNFSICELLNSPSYSRGFLASKALFPSYKLFIIFKVIRFLSDRLFDQKPPKVGLICLERPNTWRYFVLVTGRHVEWRQIPHREVLF